VTVPELKQSVQALCPEISPRLIEDFLVRIGEDYLAAFSAEVIATHIRMASALDDDHRVKVHINRPGEGEFDITIVGFDYLAQFSLFCGLLSAFGLDIRTGDIYSFSKQSRSSKVVDIFRVALKPGEVFDEAKQDEFERELQTLANLLAQGSVDEARARLNRFLTERIEGMNEELSGLLSPIELTFDNQTSPSWTVMGVRSPDTFAFLYAVSNALSMRGVYINRVKISNVSGQTRDEFFITNRWGSKIAEGLEQERLRTAVGMIKQFTHFLTDAPDPAKAMRHFDQFLDKIVEIGEDEFPDRTISLLAGSEGMSKLAHLLGSSDYLWNDFLRIHFRELLPMIEAPPDVPGKRALQQELRATMDSAPVDDRKAIFNAFKDRELFLIDVQHLLQPDATLDEFSRALTDLADVVVEEAARIGYLTLAEKLGNPRRAFSILALGKFGGREMGYASDLELMFIHDVSGGERKPDREQPASDGGSQDFFEALAHFIVDFIETRDKGIFHIDLRLRPYGDAGTWSTSIDQFTKYYRVGGEAAPFERQALIKLRWCAGDEDLGRRVEAQRDAFTYSGERWDWEDALHMRRRQMHELVKPGQVNVKYSAGGIIDIEYAVQYLQLLNGKEHPEVRVPTTLEALDQLRRLQIVRESDYRLLHSSYLFLRNLIDALRIVRGDASDLVLPDESSDEFKSLARRLGYRNRDRAKSASLLAADIHETMKRANAYFQARFERIVSESDG
jgi:[glutamine synthetase] adenylyltransferase / [glutamine synthetase]-adenylyl-L-tyrosine phosphorylase